MAVLVTSGSISSHHAPADIDYTDNEGKPHLPSRQLESACGMAANLACHTSLHPVLSSPAAHGLFSALVNTLIHSSDATVL